MAGIWYYHGVGSSEILNLLRSIVNVGSIVGSSGNAGQVAYVSVVYIGASDSILEINVLRLRPKLL